VELAAKYRFLTQQNFGLDGCSIPPYVPSKRLTECWRPACFLLATALDRKRLGSVVSIWGWGCGADALVTDNLQLGFEVFMRRRLCRAVRP
jgi:hypothetical protein